MIQQLLFNIYNLDLEFIISTIGSSILNVDKQDKNIINN